MSYLRLIINPEDDSAFLRIINTPKRAIGPVTLEKLGLFAQENHLSLLMAAADQRLGMVLSKKVCSQLHEFASLWQITPVNCSMMINLYQLSVR